MLESAKTETVDMKYLLPSNKTEAVEEKTDMIKLVDQK